MPNVPLRDIGQLGIISDRNAHDLPFQAWTDALNLRFSRGKISRYSVFKTFHESYWYTKQPIGVLEAGGVESDGCLVTVFNDGSMEQRMDGATADVTPTGTLGVSDEPSTYCKLGGLTYVNRPSDVPVFRENPSDGAFAALTGWDTNDRCSVLRSYKDYLIALNVTKTVTNYPAMVKWSDAAQVGAPPANWDVTSLSSHAGETVLNDARGAIIDGLALGDTFIIYGEAEAFRMDFIGTPLIFNFQKVFDDQGVMATNCAVAVEGRHYVFGQSDIYMHDGLSKRSIADGRILDRLMSELDFDKKDRCFVYHDQIKGEIGFCYPSIHNQCAWAANDILGCNRAMVYNYRSDTWFPVDLPSVIGWTLASQSETISWEELRKWSRSEQSWASMQGKKPIGLVLASTGHAGLTVVPQPFFLDDLTGGRLPNASNEAILWDGWAEMRYKDLDELGLEVYSRKLVTRVVPQFGAKDSTSILRIAVGQSSGANTPIKWGRLQEIEPWIDTKYDCRISDKYIAVRIDYPAGADAEFGGFDIEVMKIAER